MRHGRWNDEVSVQKHIEIGRGGENGEDEQEDRRKRSEREVTEVAATSRMMKIKTRIGKTGRAKGPAERMNGVRRVPSPSFSLCQVIFISPPFLFPVCRKRNLQPVCWSCLHGLMLILLKHYIN